MYVSSPQALPQIFRQHAGDLQVLGPSLFAELVGTDSVAFIDGDAHREARRLLVRALTNLDPAVIAGRIAALAERFAPPPDVSVPISQITEGLTREVIVDVALGELPGPRRGDVVQALGIAMTQLHSYHMASLRSDVEAAAEAHRRCRSANVRLRAVLEDEIRAALANTGGTAALPAMIHDGLTSTAELLRHLTTILVAGHETTSTALARILVYAATHSELTERVRREVRDIADPAGLVDAPRLRAFCSEVLRIETVVPNGNTRRVMREFDAAGHHYSRGTEICAFIHGRHQDFSSPHTFDPDRFLHHPPDAVTYLPFGIGRHACLGAALAMQELTVAFATFLRHSLPQIESTDRDPQRAGISMGPTVRTSDRTILRMPENRPLLRALEHARRAGLAGDRHGLGVSPRHEHEWGPLRSRGRRCSVSQRLTR